MKLSQKDNGWLPSCWLVIFFHLNFLVMLPLNHNFDFTEVKALKQQNYKKNKYIFYFLLSNRFTHYEGLLRGQGLAKNWFAEHYIIIMIIGLQSQELYIIYNIKGTCQQMNINYKHLKTNIMHWKSYLKQGWFHRHVALWGCT